MATHSSVLAWRSRDGGVWWAAIYGVAQSRTRLSSSNSFLYSPNLTSIHDYWKNHSLDQMDMSLLFNELSRLVITFLPRSKHLLISWLQSPSAVILEPPPNKVFHCFYCFPIYLPWSDETKCHDLSFLNVLSQLGQTYSWLNLYMCSVETQNLQAVFILLPYSEAAYMNHESQKRL